MQNDSLLSPGIEVKTLYGWGVVLYSDDHKLVIELDEWILAGGSSPILYAEHSAIISRSFCSIGSCVLTRYGVGVMIHYNRSSGMHHVRLWSVNGSGTALAYMNGSDLIRTIHGFSGMTASTPFGMGKVIQYRNEDDSYVVQLPYGIGYFQEKSIKIHESVILPVLEDILNKTQKESLWKNWESFIHTTSSTQSEDIWVSLANMFEKFRQGELNVDEAIANNAKYFKEKVEYLKLESLPVLLKGDELLTQPAKMHELLCKGSQRLRELINHPNNNIKEIGATAQETITKYLNEVNIHMNKLSIASTSEISISGLELTKNESLQQLMSLVQTDPLFELKDLANKLKNSAKGSVGAAVAELATLKDSKAVTIIEDGRTVLRDRIDNLLTTPEVNEIGLIGKRVLSKSRSEITTKGLAIFEAAKSRITARLSQSDLHQRLITMVESKLQDVLLSMGGSSAVSLTGTAAAAQLDKLTHLLTLLGEGKLSSTEAMKGGLSGISRSFHANDWKMFVRRQLINSLTSVVVQLQQMAPDIPITGYDFKRWYSGRNSAKAGKLAKACLASLAEGRGLASSTTSLWIQKLSTLGSATVASGTSIESVVAVARNALDSDSVTSGAKKLLETGTYAVAALEAVRESDAMQTMLGRLRDLDLEETLAASFNAIDPETMLDNAEAAISDPIKRAQMLNRLKDRVLDVLVATLPSLSFPDINAENENLEYGISGLNLSGFKIKREGVSVGLKAANLPIFSASEPTTSTRSTVGSDMITSITPDKSPLELEFCASQLNAEFKDIQWRFKQIMFPYLSGSGVGDASVEGAAIKLTFKLVRVPKGTADAVSSCQGDLEAVSERLSAIGLAGAISKAQATAYQSTISQQILPTINSTIGGGLGANTASSTSSSTSTTSNPIPDPRPLQDIWEDIDIKEWQPVLVLSSRQVHMTKLLLTIPPSSSTIGWLLSVLAKLFSGVVRDYVCRQLEAVIQSHASSLLAAANSAAGHCWPLLEQTLQVSTDSLPKASAEDLMSLVGLLAQSNTNEEIDVEVVLVLGEVEGPLGLTLDIFLETDPKNGHYAVVTGALPNSQGYRELERLGLLGSINGALIKSVNGQSLKGLQEEMILNALRGPRPLRISVRLVPEEPPTEPKKDTPPALEPVVPAANDTFLGSLLPVTFQEESLGLVLRECRLFGGSAIVAGISGDLKNKGGREKLQKGMLLVSVEDESMLKTSFDTILATITGRQRPLHMCFSVYPDRIVFLPIDKDIHVEAVNGYFIVRSSLDELRTGHFALLQVGGTDVSSKTASQDVLDRIESSARPLKLVVRNLDIYSSLKAMSSKK